MLETADRLTEEREPSVQQYLLLAGALRSMAEGAHDPGLVLDAYLLRALAIAGWAPSFHDCARCGAEGPHRAFNLAAGGTVCPVCRPPGSAAPAPETLELLAALLAGDWTVADASDVRHRREGTGLATAFLQWHLERGVRSLRLVERRDPSAPPPAPQLRVEAQA
jgi:DNA repair protein RecO (recombination protein O)